MWKEAGQWQMSPSADCYDGWLPRSPPPASTRSARSGVELWDLRGWHEAIQQWQDPHRQQDVGAFLQHLAPRLADNLENQRWQSRTQDGADPTRQARVSDQGTLWPLVLSASLPMLQAHLSNSPLSLQQLLIAWRDQAARHAILEPPDLLAVQVNRFSPDGSKVHTPIRLSTAVYVPEIQWDRSTDDLGAI